MIFSTDLCPICNSKLEMESQCMGATCVFTYFCTARGFKAWDKKFTNYIEVYHYSHREFQRLEDQSIMGNISETIYPPYLIKHQQQLKKSRIYFLPVGEKPSQFITDCPLLDVDWTNEKDIVKKIKTLITFS